MPPGTLKNLFFPPEKGEYTYFKRAKECPFGASDLTRAAWAADASMLSYAHYGEAPMPGGDFNAYLDSAGLTSRTLIGDWNAPGTQGFFASCDDFAILAFRGTEIHDRVDQEDDADILLVPEPDYRLAPGHAGPSLGHFAFVEHLFDRPCLVHRGFRGALNRVWDQVHACVSAYRHTRPNAEICFTGHSLGGALATLAFSRFADPASSLVTVGCPRVGNQVFRDRVLSRPGKGIFRFVNLNDTVPHVPPDSCFYCQTPGECLRFDEQGKLAPGDSTFLGDRNAIRLALESLAVDFSKLDSIDAPSGLVDHSPVRYCIRLWDCV
jgi:triacylglycerol lipase